MDNDIEKEINEAFEKLNRLIRKKYNDDSYDCIVLFSGDNVDSIDCMTALSPRDTHLMINTISHKMYTALSHSFTQLLRDKLSDDESEYLH